ncbi:hypothetical protein HYH03_006428 [Edaphochlamys debaryana]|uniref:Uncharacterized protein n=1 Tax=Edaphochlamys debaryana TaxID=47281 RepID=A0A835Y3X9_9CHLO|nr:hypothetical protein HYH03_006428 [Edaphochlamys debaryana]|eukprot:KAG2495483.1 hypothetical protein HYH03_006428 [Edaphochlamys debaryana]
MEVEEVEFRKLSRDTRVLCDSCATSIPGLHRHCPECDREFCPDCCVEARSGGSSSGAVAGSGGHQAAGGGSGPPAPLPRLDPRCPGATQLWTSLKKDVRDLLGKAAEECGGVLHPGPSYPDPRLIERATAGRGREQAGARLERPRRDDEAAVADLLRGLKPFVPGEAVPEGHVGAWGRYVLPKEDVRLAETTGETERYIFTPHASTLRPGHPLHVPYTLLVLERLRLSEPVGIRGVRSDRPDLWTMEALLGPQSSGGVPEEPVQVPLTTEGKSKSKGKRLYEVLPEQWKDFVQQLPLPWMTAPSKAPLNLAADTPVNKYFYDADHEIWVGSGSNDVPKDGSEPRGVTRLRVTMGDVVQLLHFVGPSEQGGPAGAAGSGRAVGELPGYGDAGVVWDIWSPGEDTDRLRRYLKEHAAEFPGLADAMDPILSEKAYLGERHREELEAMGVRSWRFKQYEGEAVIIPAGCPNQARNLAPCIRTHYAFMTPESVGQCLALAALYRSLPRKPWATKYKPREDPSREVAQVLPCSLHAVVKCYRTLHPVAASGAARTQRQPAPGAHTAGAAAGGQGAEAGPSGSQPRPRRGPTAPARLHKRRSSASGVVEAAVPGTAQPRAGKAKWRRVVDGTGPGGAAGQSAPSQQNAEAGGGLALSGSAGNAAAGPAPQPNPMHVDAATPAGAAEAEQRRQPGRGPSQATKRGELPRSGEAMEDEPPPPPESPGPEHGEAAGLPAHLQPSQARALPPLQQSAAVKEEPPQQQPTGALAVAVDEVGPGPSEVRLPSASPHVQLGVGALQPASLQAEEAAPTPQPHGAPPIQQGAPPELAMQPSGAGQPPSLVPVRRQMVAAAQPPQLLAAPVAGSNSLLPASSLSAAHLQGCALSRDAVRPPALQPGELRLCGLTFHPELAPGVRSAMEAWEAGLAEQLAAEGLDGGLADAAPEERQITVLDPSALTGIQPCVITADLSDLLGLSLDWGKALPQDASLLPVIEPRPDEGRGGAGLFAAAALRKGAVLGVMGGYVMPKDAAKRFTGQGWRSLPSDAVTELAARSGQDNPWRAWKLLAGSLQMPVPGSPDGWELSMLGYGSLAALINDPRREPRGWVEGNDVGDEGGAAARAANCAVVPVSVRGLTLPVVVALRDIQPGEQLLRDYGAAWWTAIHNTLCVAEGAGLAATAILHRQEELHTFQVSL